MLVQTRHVYLWIQYTFTWGYNVLITADIAYSSLQIQWNSNHSCGNDYLIYTCTHHWEYNVLADTMYSFLRIQCTHPCRYNVILPADKIYSSLRIHCFYPRRYGAIILVETIILYLIVAQCTLNSFLKIQLLVYISGHKPAASFFPSCIEHHAHIIIIPICAL